VIRQKPYLARSRLPDGKQPLNSDPGRTGRALRVMLVESMPRESFNPKGALHDAAMLSPAQVDYWAEAARYSGNPEHKRNPGDFGLTPPAAARIGKTLCDKVGIFSRNTALDLLREGLRRGLVSRQQRDGWPQNVWAITPAGEPLEAQLEGDGVYHGCPMPENDPFRDVVLRRLGLA
jgi:hypothetical protein